MKFTHQIFCLLIAASCLLTIETLLLALPVSQQEWELRSVDGFSDLRQEVLNLISGAKYRIWLTSDFISDGDIVAGLYIAKYRKVDVKVLLGQKKAKNYMSRLAFLKKQEIPTFLKPAHFQVKYPTAIVADDVLVYIDGDLDFLAKDRKFVIKLSSNEGMSKYLEGFSGAIKQAIPAVPQPMVNIKERLHQSHSAGTTRTLPRVYSSYSEDEIQGSYKYSSVKSPPPPGISNALPKQTIWQLIEKEKNREKSSSKKEGDTIGDKKSK